MSAEWNSSLGGTLLDSFFSRNGHDYLHTWWAPQWPTKQYSKCLQIIIDCWLNAKLLIIYQSKRVRSLLMATWQIRKQNRKSSKEIIPVEALVRLCTKSPMKANFFPCDSCSLLPDYLLTPSIIEAFVIANKMEFKLSVWFQVDCKPLDALNVKLPI